MEVEKRSSKGGFLQLFDWNLKSRKKLFSNKSELPENGKHGEEYADGLAIPCIQHVHENGRVPGANAINELHYQSAPSASEEHGSEAKAPGVVARLMGLDSMPSSHASDYSTPTFESQPFNDLDYIRSLNFHDENHIVIFESTRSKTNRMPKNPLELKLQKMQRPIERFQSEVLPSKTAKPVSISHNRLMSPIKSPGFIPPKNAAFVMEEAARIIEQSPRSTAKCKSSSLVSSSATLRFHEQNEKMIASKKTSIISDATNKQYPSKHLRRKPCEKGDVNLTSKASEVARQSLKTKDKLAPPTVKVKSTAQRRDGMTSLSRTSGNKIEGRETNPSYSTKNPPNSRRNIEKKNSSSRSSEVLRQNNQKQNSVTSKGEQSSRPSTSNQKGRKVLPTSDIARKNKINKIIINPTARSGETNSMVVDSRRDSSEFQINKISRKKLPDNPDAHSFKSAENREGENSVKCNVSSEGRNDFDVIDRQNRFDVVSFTFTSPIKKSFLGSGSSTQSTEKNQNSRLISCENDGSSKFSVASGSGINEVGGDALSILLEQKLKELTSKVEEPLQDQVKETNSISSNQSDSCTDAIRFSASKDWQGSGVTLEHTSFKKNLWKSNSDSPNSSPVSNHKLSVLEGSRNSLDSNQSSISEVSGSKWCSSFENDEVSDQSSTSISQITDGDFDLADSACSASAWSMMATDNTSSFTTSKGPYHWELEYIKSIINNADLMLEEFALGHVHRVMDPNIFDNLESHIIESKKNLEEQFRVARRALFDCVEECLQSRCKRNFCGSFRAWSKWMVVFQRSDHLAEDLYREIFSLTNMAELMVDELVDKDMSNHDGRWVEFESETFEEGIEIENEILTSLVDEVLGDIFVSKAL
ncbi:transferase [Lithospermum erythrorhizon]|uniref:Transferase n=1 Tax=Lithospermum erythrorhizon TaxID=34254 RepID=A0AAV3NSK3_LITER